MRFFSCKVTQLKFELPYLLYFVAVTYRIVRLGFVNKGLINEVLTFVSKNSGWGELEGSEIKNRGPVYFQNQIACLWLKTN